MLIALHKIGRWPKVPATVAAGTDGGRKQQEGEGGRWSHAAAFLAAARTSGCRLDNDEKWGAALGGRQRWALGSARTTTRSDARVGVSFPPGRFMNLELLACYSVHLLCVIHHLRCLGNNYRSRAGEHSMHASKSQHVL